MSGKNPAFQFYPNDYFRDTRILTPASRGIWMDVLCVLWWTEPGIRKKTLNVDDWSRLLSVTVDEFLSSISQFEKHNICDVSRECNGDVTIVSRRMLRDDDLRAKANKRQRNKRSRDKSSSKRNDAVTDLSHDSSSSSSSSVTKVTFSEEESENKIFMFLVERPELSNLTYEQYLCAIRKHGYKIDEPDMKMAEQCVHEVVIFGQPDHPGVWFAKFVERYREKQEKNGVGVDPDDPRNRKKSHEERFGD